MDFGPKNSMEVLYSCPEEFRLEGRLFFLYKITISVLNLKPPDYIILVKRCDHVIKGSEFFHSMSRHGLIFSRFLTETSFAGPEKRVCKKASKTWEPTEERNTETKCVREEK